MTSSSSHPFAAQSCRGRGTRDQIMQSTTAATTTTTTTTTGGGGQSRLFLGRSHVLSVFLSVFLVSFLAVYNTPWENSHRKTTAAAAAAAAADVVVVDAEKSTIKHNNKNNKAYVHVGGPKTGTSTIQTALNAHWSLLHKDGYDSSIDRLLSFCLYSDEMKERMERDLFPGRVCPDSKIYNMYGLLNHTAKNGHKFVISHEGFSRNTSEYGLDSFFDSSWDVEIVVYYRRYYDWLLSVNFQHRLMKEVDADDDNTKKWDQDFLITEAVRRFAFSGMDRLDWPYAKFVVDRFAKIPRFANKITLVNFHDGDLVTNFYCNVLVNATHACEKAKQLEKEGNTIKSNVGFNLDYEELSFLAFREGLWKKTPQGRFAQQMKFWGNKYRKRLEEKANKTIHDLPRECLTTIEMDKLLNVSLEFEKQMFPNWYTSDAGEKELRNDFKAKSNRFCSLDGTKIFRNETWRRILFYTSSHPEETRVS